MSTSTFQSQLLTDGWSPGNLRTGQSDLPTYKILSCDNSSSVLSSSVKYTRATGAENVAKGKTAEYFVHFERADIWQVLLYVVSCTVSFQPEIGDNRWQNLSKSNFKIEIQ